MARSCSGFYFCANLWNSFLSRGWCSQHRFIALCDSVKTSRNQRLDVHLLNVASLQLISVMFLCVCRAGAVKTHFWGEATVPAGASAPKPSRFLCSTPVGASETVFSRKHFEHRG